jgi:hypothetical protein
LRLRLLAIGERPDSTSWVLQQKERHGGAREKRQFGQALKFRDAPAARTQIIRVVLSAPAAANYGETGLRGTLKHSQRAALPWCSQSSERAGTLRLPKTENQVLHLAAENPSIARGERANLQPCQNKRRRPLLLSWSRRQEFTSKVCPRNSHGQVSSVTIFIKRALRDMIQKSYTASRWHEHIQCEDDYDPHTTF